MTFTGLPESGRRLALIGKGGSGKSTTLGLVLSQWAADGVPVVGFDADEPGEGEHGSLLTWAQMLEEQGGLGCPVYRASDNAFIRSETTRLTPACGIGAIDTGAWERRPGNRHMAVLSAVDVAVLALQPTLMEIERSGSVMAALEQLEAVGAPVPKLVILLTMVNPSARSAADTRADLEAGGLQVLKTVVPRSDARDGYAQAFGMKPRLVPGSPMAELAAELLDVLR